MKNLLKQLLFIYFTITTLCAFGQGLNVHGIVTDQMGSPYATLEITLMDTITFETKVVVSDSNGEYSALFNVASTNGVIRLTYNNCNNYRVDYNLNYEMLQTDITKDFKYCPGPCSIEILKDISIPGQTTLTAIASPNDLESIEWSNGSHENSITILNENLTHLFWAKSYYTDGCIAYDEILFDSPTQCNANIYVNADDAGNGILYVYNNSNFNSYLWSNGSTDETITVNDSEIYCVTVTNGADCISTACAHPSDSCGLYVDFAIENNMYKLTALSYGMGIPSYLWSNGATTKSILLSATLPSVLYCVTVTTNFGCQTTGYIQTQDPNICSTGIFHHTTPGSPELTLSVNFVPTLPAEILWNTGATTSTITTTGHGSYCVTVTNIAGCTSTSCYDFNSDSCTSYIFKDVNSNVLTAYSNGTGPFYYIWYTGQHTQSIPYTNEPVSVTIVDAAGCWSTAYYDANDPNYKNISGKVFPNNPVGLEHAKIYLIKASENPQQNDHFLLAIDSVALDYVNTGMEFSFDNLEEGCYYLKASMEPGSYGYDFNMPTYYSEQILWEDAVCINIPNSQHLIANINLINGDNPGGPGFIGGYVSEGAGFADDGIEVRDEEPFVHANILLTTLDDVAVTHTLTDGAGLYKFDSLAYGTYKVILEVAGEKTQLITITIGVDNPSVTNANLTRAILKNYNKSAFSNYKLFPNPTNGDLYISCGNVDYSEFKATIFDVHGKAIETFRYDNKSVNTEIKLSTNKLTSGIYFLTLTNKNESGIFKFVKIN